MQKLTFLLAIIIFAPLVKANEITYEECSLKSAETFRYYDYYMSRVPIEKAKKLAKNPKRVIWVYKFSKVYGAPLVNMLEHKEYQQCTLSVDRKLRLTNTSKLTNTELQYKKCSFQSITRTTILEYFDKRLGIKEIKEKLPSQHHDVASSLHSKKEGESFVGALSFSGRLLVQCIESIQ